LMPDAPQIWNSKAYAEAFSGDLENAKKSAQRYQALAPDDANSYDSLGEIVYMHGHFAEAAASFQTGFQKLPNAFGANMLRKAAWAHLREGNVAEADKVFAQYIEFRQKLGDTFIPLRQAQWAYLGGKHDAAKQQLESFAVEKSNSYAWAQLSIWERFEGQQSKAMEYAQKAIQGLASAPQYRNPVAIAAVLALPNAASEVWKQRMNGQPIAAIGMLISGDPDGAAQFLGEVRSKISPLQEYYWKDLHAVALYRAGKKDQAKVLLTIYSLPEAEEDAIVLCFAFPADQEIRRELKK
jgi:tetratricopeptide (TPR) repeat protein